MRDYIVRRAAKIDENVDGENFLARTVYEDHELVDIGVLDKDGNKVMARNRPDQVGFIRWGDKPARHHAKQFTLRELDDQ